MVIPFIDAEVAPETGKITILDMKYLSKYIGQFSCGGVIDTLHLSAVLFLCENSEIKHKIIDKNDFKSYN